MNKHILIIDDRKDSVDAMTDYFEYHKYLVSAYTNGREAIQSIQEGLRYDVAIVDRSLNDHGIDGEDVIKESKKVNPKVPVICISGWGELNSGLADKFFQKLVSMKVVKNSIEELLKKN